MLAPRPVITQWSLTPETLTSRPQLAAHIAAVVATGAEIELAWAQLLASITHTDPHLALLMFEQLRGDAQIITIKDIAEDRLSAEDWLLFRAVKAVVDPCRKTRNDFCHHMWAESPEAPEALILIPPSEMLHLHARRPHTAPHRDLRFPDPKKIVVFREEDLRREHERARDALLALRSLTNILVIDQMGHRFAEFDTPITTVEQRAKLSAQSSVAAQLKQIDAVKEKAKREERRKSRRQRPLPPNGE